MSSLKSHVWNFVVSDRVLAAGHSSRYMSGSAGDVVGRSWDSGCSHLVDNELMSNNSGGVCG